MYEELLKTLSERPKIYEWGGSKFWNDEHISKWMLKTHLDPDDDLATRKPGFVKESADWIAAMAKGRGRLLDLGCGPGIYAEAFTERGFKVKGLDFSPRSIAYAKSSAEEKGLEIEYVCGDYLETDFGGPYDLAMILYGEMNVFSPEEVLSILRRVWASLSPQGHLIIAPLPDGKPVAARDAGGHPDVHDH